MVQYGERIYGLWGQNILGPNPTFACYLNCVTLGKSLNVCSCRKCDRSADVLRGLGAEQTVACIVADSLCVGSNAPPAQPGWEERFRTAHFQKALLPPQQEVRRGPPARSQRFPCCFSFFQERVGYACIQNRILGCLEILDL